MRYIIQYIRSCFCNHEWELIFATKVYANSNIYWCKTYRCKKCGYSRRYKSH